MKKKPVRKVDAKKDYKNKKRKRKRRWTKFLSIFHGESQKNINS